MSQTLSRKQIASLFSNIEELASLFHVSEEKEFLMKFIAEPDIQQCLNCGSTNLENVDMLCRLLVSQNNATLFDGLKMYLFNKHCQYKKLWESLDEPSALSSITQCSSTSLSTPPLQISQSNQASGHSLVHQDESIQLLQKKLEIYNEELLLWQEQSRTLASCLLQATTMKPVESACDPPAISFVENETQTSSEEPEMATSIIPSASASSLPLEQYTQAMLDDAARPETVWYGCRPLLCSSDGAFHLSWRGIEAEESWRRLVQSNDESQHLISRIYLPKALSGRVLTLWLERRGQDLCWYISWYFDTTDKSTLRLSWRMQMSLNLKSAVQQQTDMKLMKSGNCSVATSISEMARFPGVQWGNLNPLVTPHGLLYLFLESAPL